MVFLLRIKLCVCLLIKRYLQHRITLGQGENRSLYFPVLCAVYGASAGYMKRLVPGFYYAYCCAYALG